MKLLDKKYYNLEPKFEYLQDEFILGLAWKKLTLLYEHIIGMQTF